MSKITKHLIKDDNQEWQFYQAELYRIFHFELSARRVISASSTVNVAGPELGRQRVPVTVEQQ
jgi:hypothetical protein